MKNIKYTVYVIKELITKVPTYSLVYITIVIISSLLVPAQIIYTQRLIDSIINNSDNVFVYTILLLITIVGGTVLHTLNTFIKPRLEHRFYIKFMGSVYVKISNIDYIEFEKSDNQDLFNNLTANPSKKVIYTFYELINVVFYLVSLLGIVFSFFYMTPIIGIIALIVSLPMYLSECKGVNDEINYRWNMTKEIRKRAYIQSLFVDKEALQEIKVYNEKDYLFMKSDELTNTINDDLLKVVKKSILFTSFSSFIMIVFLLVIFIAITYFIIHGEMIIASYIAILTALGKFFHSSKSSTYAIASYLRQCKYMQLQEDFFALPEQDTMNNSNKIKKDHLDIEFKDVSFRYPNTNKDVLSNINLKIKTNERVALVGENGCGKSTLVKLLCGLYKPDSGVILINGVPTTEIGFTGMKKLISIIFQDYQHFQLSIRENVALAKIEEVYNDKKINKQLEIMKLDYLTSNENNLETKLGKIYDDGINISHGEWQKLSLSRMMFNTNKLAILDEPTSALDPIIESKMYEYISENLKDIGLILVSHRLSSVKLVKRILVIDNGGIVEDGSHSELMKNEGLYYKMYKSQSEWYIVDGDKDEK